MAIVGPAVKPLSEFLSWDEADQDAQMQWHRHESERCPGCGHHPDDLAVHHHVVVCPVCADRESLSSEAAEKPGGHVIPVTGNRRDCPVCKASVADRMNERKARAKRG